MKKSLIPLLALTAGTLHAADLFVTDYLFPVNPEIYEQVLTDCQAQDACPDIQITYLKSNHPTINASVNGRINELIGIKSSSDDAIPTESAFAVFVSDVAKGQDPDEKHGHVFTYTPQYTGHYKQLELFALNGYTYLGGAHGLSFRQNLVFEDGKLLALSDILENGQKSALFTLAQSAFDRWCEENELERDAQYETFFLFTLTENFSFNAQGLVLTYQPYEIAPYAFGFPELIIPYQELNGIIKPAYLPRSGKAD